MGRGGVGIGETMTIKERAEKFFFDEDVPEHHRTGTVFLDEAIVFAEKEALRAVSVEHDKVQSWVAEGFGLRAAQQFAADFEPDEAIGQATANQSATSTIEERASAHWLEYVDLGYSRVLPAMVAFAKAEVLRARIEELEWVARHCLPSVQSDAYDVRRRIDFYRAELTKLERP